MALCTYCCSLSLSTQLPTAQPTTPWNRSTAECRKRVNMHVCKSLLYSDGDLMFCFFLIRGHAWSSGRAVTQLIQLSLSAPPLRHTHSDLSSDKTCWHNMWCKAAQSSLYIFKTFCFIKEQHLVFNIIFFSKRYIQLGGLECWSWRPKRLEVARCPCCAELLLCPPPPLTDRVRNHKASRAYFFSSSFFNILIL